MKKIVIFDFDGTLADTLDAIVRITNRLSEEFGYQPTHPEKLSQIQNLSSWQIIQQSGISWLKLPVLVQRVKTELKNDLDLIYLFPGISHVLMELKQQSYQLYIITSNSKSNVITVLERYHLIPLFNNIYSGITLFGKDRMINKLLFHEKISPEQAIYIGDETRDIEAAKKSKVKSIAVSWAFNSAQVLAQHHPDRLIHNPQELIPTIAQLIL